MLLARLGLAEPSASLHTGPHPGPFQPSPIAEEGSGGQEADQAAEDCLQAGSAQQQLQEGQQQQWQLQPLQQKEQQEQQHQIPGAHMKLHPMQSATGGKSLQRRSARQRKHLTASTEAKLLSEAAQKSVDINGTDIDDGDGDGDAGAARHTAAGQTDLAAVPVSSSSPAGRAAFASLGNTRSSPLQSELPYLKHATVCRQLSTNTLHDLCMLLAARHALASRSCSLVM